jgi:methionyl-tRNA formyltransferase
MLRIVLITGDDLEHHYLANRISAEFDLAAIVVDRGKPLGRLQRIKQLWRRYSIGQLLSRCVLALLRRVGKDESRRRERIMQVFGTELCLQFLKPNLLCHVQGINSPKAENLIANLNPDIILVFGTGIVKDKVLSKAKLIALNMHTGISPYYRGCDCSFWPVHNGDPGSLGATVHECTKDIDGGKIFGTVRADLVRDDCLFSIFARCVVAGTNLYIKTISELTAGRSNPTKQNLGLGVEYRAHQRGLHAELRARRNVREGLIARYVDQLGPHGSKFVERSQVDFVAN